MASTPGNLRGVTGAATTRPGAVVVGSGSGRDRDGRAITGVAVARGVTDLNYVSFPLYGPWGNWCPWYGSGFGWNAGFLYYDPWRYPGTSWGWGRYGMWYDPWAYSSYYDPYYDPYYSGGGGGGSSSPKVKSTMGSIRLKANVSLAQVYIDGALYGTVDEFDGLSNHLELDGGRHLLELRADGYESYSKEINVEAGKTLTHRASLKKK
jgi:PEGA domain